LGIDEGADGAGGERTWLLVELERIADEDNAETG
jgi:hypothetical protein